jgi:hypothetical protein
MRDPAPPLNRPCARDYVPPTQWPLGSGSSNSEVHFTILRDGAGEVQCGADQG